jgi:hypothetical protein
MENFINYTVFLLFLGGLFSLVLSVIIIIAKQEHRRSIERGRLEAVKQKDPELVGDIEAKLNDSFEFRKFDFGELLTIWSLQPLLIICFVNLFSAQGTVEVIITFALTIFIILHEFWTSNQFSKSRWYQFLIFILWIILFFTISYRDNILNGNQKGKAGISLFLSDFSFNPNAS